MHQRIIFNLTRQGSKRKKKRNRGFDSLKCSLVVHKDFKPLLHKRFKPLNLNKQEIQSLITQSDPQPITAKIQSLTIKATNHNEDTVIYNPTNHQQQPITRKIHSLTTQSANHQTEDSLHSQTFLRNTLSERQRKGADQSQPSLSPLPFRLLEHLIRGTCRIHPIRIGK